MNETTHTTPEEYKKIKLSETWDVTIWVLGQVYKMMPVKLILYIIGQAMQNLYGLGNWYIFAKTLDRIISILQNPNPSITSIYPYLGVMLVYNLAGTVINLFVNYNRNYIQNLSRPLFRQLFYTKLHKLGIQNLEQPEVNNRIHRADEYLSQIPSYINGSVELIVEVIRTVVTLGIIFTITPYLALLIALSAIPFILWDRKYRTLLHKFSFENTEGNRVSNFTANDLSNSNKLQEININKAFNFLDDKFISFRKWFVMSYIKLIKNWISGNNTARLISDIVVFMAYIKVFTNMISGLISVGTVTFQLRTLSDFQNSLMNVMRRMNDLLESSIQIREVYLLFRTEPAFPDGTISFHKLEQGPEIEFRNVDFKYPNSEKLVLKDLNIKIASGEKVAIVGHNGAGKTTMVKLLARIYQTSGGEILINGQNVNKLKIGDLYDNMGILFQDFNVYSQLTVRENIYLGNPIEPVNEMAIRLAAQAADATDFIEEFPDKYDQVLSEKFKKGIRPSTGQWQKLAIARFFYRNAPLVIFDEPTASIDAVSEYHIFNRIYEFFEKKTVIIISHRFSTVRNADRILVVDKGMVIEEGNHTELMALNGKYTEAFMLQAKGYVSDITNNV